MHLLLASNTISDSDMTSNWNNWNKVFDEQMSDYCALIVVKFQMQILSKSELSTEKTTNVANMGLLSVNAKHCYYEVVSHIFCGQLNYQQDFLEFAENFAKMDISQKFDQSVKLEKKSADRSTVIYTC